MISGMNESRAQLCFELALALGFAEPGDPLRRGREQHALPGEARADAQGGRDVGFAGAWWAEQDHVLAAVQEVELAEVLDHRLLHGALEGEVELLERLARGEPSGLDAALAAVAVAGADLGAQQDLGEPLIAPGLLPGPVSQRRAAPWRRRALSARGTGARARLAWSCRDQPVIARQRPDLDLDLVALTALVSRWRSSRV